MLPAATFQRFLLLISIFFLSSSKDSMKHRVVEHPIARSSFSFFSLIKVSSPPFLPTTTAITTAFQPPYPALTLDLISPSSSHSPPNQASCPPPSYSLDSFSPPPPSPPPPPAPPPALPPPLSSTTATITVHSTPPYPYPPLHSISPSTTTPTPQASSPPPSPSSNSSISFHNPTSKLSLVSSSSASYHLNSSRAKANGIPKGCDVSKGEWIPDPTAPYYTNSTCWMIQEHQNCMKYGRPNLDFLKWRWKPDGCHLPLLEPIEFLDFMRGKNLAFIGDSLARNQMQSLICLLSRLEYPEEIRPSAGDSITQMFYPEHNFTIWTFWSPFLIRAKESTANYKFSVWDLYLDEPDPLWQPYLGRFDFVILNTGNWYTRPAHFHDKRILLGCHYCVLKKVPFMSVYKAHRRAFHTALDAIVGNGQGFRGLTVVRTVSPSHFEGGEWNIGGDCKRTSPMRRGEWKMKGMDLELYKDQLREFWKAKWEGSEKGLDFRLLDTTGAMQLRPDGHPSKYGHWPYEKRVLYNDCVHWCLPGPVDMWNDFFFSSDENLRNSVLRRCRT